MRSALSLHFSRLYKSVLSACPHMAGFPVLGSSLWPFSWPSPACPHLCNIEGTKSEHSILGVAWQTLSRVGDWLNFLCWWCPCDATHHPIGLLQQHNSLSLLFTRTPSSTCTDLFPRWTDPSMCCTPLPLLVEPYEILGFQCVFLILKS